MVTVAVCDDNPRDLEAIGTLVGEWARSRSVEIRLFSSAYDLLAAAAKGEGFDLFLLDILMPEMTGISLGERLRELYAEPLLIYLTSSEDYYPDAFRVYAFQYLCKPVQRQLLFDVLDKGLGRCRRRSQDVFPVKTAQGIVQVAFSTLVYAELRDHVCYFHLADGSVIQSRYLRTGFDEFLAPLLQSCLFVKPHTSFVVNLNYAGKLTSASLGLTTGESVPVARAFGENLRSRYFAHALGKAGEGEL